MSLRYLLIPFLFLWIFCGCSQPEAPKAPKEPQSKESFEGEDHLILSALDAHERGEFAAAATMYRELYARSGNSSYQYRLIEILMRAKEYAQAEEAAKKLLERRKDDLRAKRLLVGIYLHQEKHASAIEVATQLLAHEASEEHYELISSIYFTSGQFEDSLRFMESAYALHHSESVLQKLVGTLLLMQRRPDALSHLESHTRIYGCTRELCEQLIQLYRSEKDVNGMISVFKRLYEQFGGGGYAKSLVELYVYKNDYAGAIGFLKESGADDSLLLELYSARHDYKSAKDLAEELYRTTQNSDYLAKAAMYEYEFAPDKNVRSLLDSVRQKLERVVAATENDTYENYLGYLLIDHDLDVKEGIRLVKRALEREPNSPYYMDSLAWGYYKIGKCAEAYKVMKKVVEMLGLEEEEVKLHWEKIGACHSKGAE